MTPSVNQNQQKPSAVEQAIGFGIGNGIGMGISYGFGYTFARVLRGSSHAHDIGIHNALTFPTRQAVNYCFNKMLGDTRQNAYVNIGATMAINATASITAAYAANQLGYAINEYDVAYQQMIGIAINVGSIALILGTNYILGEDITQPTPAVAIAEIQEETAPQPASPEEQIESIIKTPMMIKV